MSERALKLKPVIEVKDYDKQLLISVELDFPVDPPDEVLVEYISGFDIIARKTSKVINGRLHSHAQVNARSLSPITKSVAVRIRNKDGHPLETAYVRKAPMNWYNISWSDFSAEMLGLQSRYKRKYSHW